MTIQKGRQIALIDELTVETPRKSKDHRKEINLARRTVGSIKLELPKIHLGLVARFSWSLSWGS